MLFFTIFLGKVSHGFAVQRWWQLYSGRAFQANMVQALFFRDWCATSPLCLTDLVIVFHVSLGTLLGHLCV